MRKIWQNLRIVSSSFEPIDWDNVDTCVLDMDGTLLDLYFDNQFWHEHLPLRFAELSGMHADAARTHVRATLTAARGTLTGYCIDHWSEVFGLELNALEHELRDLIQVRPCSREFLTALRDHGIRLLLATNAPPRSLARKLEQTGIGSYFNEIISSHDFGYPKEFDEFWQALANRFTVEPSRTLFIDDNLAVLTAARRFGIRYLFGIAQPDSRGERVRHPNFHNLERLTDITVALGNR